MARRQVKSLASTFSEPQVNVTPLIDVVFVLLISFIVIAPLVELDRIELASAQSKDTKTCIHFEEASPIQIHVHKDNTILINKQSINTIFELSALLKEAKTRFPGARAQLFHHKEAYFGTYQAVKNALEQAEFAELDIVLLPS